MAAQLLALYGTPDDPTAFEQHYYGTHVPLAKRLAGLRSYTTSKGAVAGAGGAAAYYLVAILEFDSLAAIAEAMASPEGREISRDAGKMATGGITTVMFETQSV